MALNCADFYDAELRRYNAHLRAAARVGVHDRVLDIGCGAGQTTREAARVAVQGSVLGIDVSAPMLEIARQRSADEGLHNVTYEQADAQSHAFQFANFDLCISRFGVMFFADPATAFANIGRSMRPGARLVWMVWQNLDRNQWSGAVRQALSLEPVQKAAAFSLADPDNTLNLLRSAGFSSIDFAEVREPVLYGEDIDVAYDALISLHFNGVQKATKEVQLRLCELLRAHLTSEGVFFDSCAWIITACRASR